MWLGRLLCHQVFFLALRLHREALKQSATDPKTGIIDISILTTGVSSSERIRRQMIAKELKKMLQVEWFSSRFSLPPPPQSTLCKIIAFTP